MSRKLAYFALATIGCYSPFETRGASEDGGTETGSGGASGASGSGGVIDSGGVGGTADSSDGDIDAGPETGTDAGTGGSDASIDGGTAGTGGAGGTAGTGGSAGSQEGGTIDAGTDAGTAEAGSCTVGSNYCEGNQPKFCAATGPENYGGVCNFGCDTSNGLCKCNGLWGIFMTFGSPPAVPSNVQGQAYTNVQTNFRWTSRVKPLTSVFYTTTQATAKTWCDMVPGQFRLPTLAEFQEWKIQEGTWYAEHCSGGAFNHPVNHAYVSSSTCFWTSTSNTPGKFETISTVDYKVTERFDNEACEVMCVKSQ